MPNNRIKIFFFIDSFHIGGMHRQILYLVKHLNKEIFEPILCTQIPVGGLRGEFEQIGCKLFDLKWKRKLDLTTIFRLVKILDSENPDIIFITEAQTLFYYRLARIFWHKRIIQIGSFRALTFWKGHLKKHYKPIDNFFSKWLYDTSEHIVVNSDAMRYHYSSILTLNPTKLIKTIYNGSDFEFEVTKVPTTIREELNISHDDIVIIMVARLDPWKDFTTLFEAAKLVCEADNRAKFLIVGTGILKTELKQLIVQMELTDNVLLIGEKKDIYNYLNAADISVLSTNGEGFSNTILESMALGKPIIATKVGGNPELIGSNSKSGLLVPPKSSQLFADAILTLMRDEVLRHEMGQSAKQRIHQLCSINKYISSYENLFLQCMNNK